MEITDIKIFRQDSPNSKLRAFVSVVFDNVFVVRNIRIIEGLNKLFIAMPSKKIKQPCSKCGFKNELYSKFCNQCGTRIPISSQPPDQGINKDFVYPIRQYFRRHLEEKILEAYKQEKAKNV